MDIAAWLHGLGLEQYEQAFCENAIDASVLPELSADDLKDLGVRLVGHRRKLLAAIAALRSDIDDTAVAASTAERRQLTVMFCDLVGSTALSVRLDPEDLREVLGAYHRCIRDTIAPLEGFVAKYMGDGALVYFGYPHAHEDDAERAVRAALALITASAGVAVADSKLRLRIGIATGLAVVGDLIGIGAAQEEAVVGETPNLAARLQALAEPDTIVIAEGTRRLVGSLFELADLGPQDLKGFTEPHRAWRVIGTSHVPSRFEALRASTSTLIGRAEELERLSRLWSEAKTGQGRAVLVSGEPGVGKSRLTAEFRDRLQREPHTDLRYFCSPHHQESALFPVIDQLERGAGFERDDPPAAKLDKLRALLPAASEQEMSLILELLSLTIPASYPPLDLSPQLKKQRTLAALLGQLESLARNKAVLAIFEDLHWADPTSLELLDLVVESLGRLPVLLVATFRPEFQSPWAGRSHVSLMTLDRLNRAEGAVLVRQLTGDQRVLTDDIVDAIIDRTDGVPLFIEELTRAVLEGGVDTVSKVAEPSLAVPSTLHSSLMARLDRLGPAAKEVAQTGAAIGRVFSFELLAAAGKLSEPELYGALQRLVDAGLIFERGIPPSSDYLFKHALVQDTAYSTLLRGPRRALHASIARALETRSATMVETTPEILAHHFTEAEILDKAVTYWCRAGQQSVAKSALVEGTAQLKRGLRLAANLPDSGDRSRQELDMQLALGAALMLAKGYAHPEVVEAFARARGLVADIGAAGTLVDFSVLWGLWTTNFVGGNAKAMLQQAEELLAIAQSLSESGLMVVGHRALGTAFMINGNYPAALPQLEQAVALYEPTEHSRYTARFTNDVGVAALSACSWALWHRGHPERAVSAERAAIRYAKQSAHASTLAFALMYSGVTEALMRRAAVAASVVKALVEHAKERGFPLILEWGSILQGWAMAHNGEVREGIELICRGLAITRRTGARFPEPFVLGLLAEAYALADDPNQGLIVLNEALTSARVTGQIGWNAELVRLRADLLRRLPRPDLSEVEAHLRAALSIARDQGTRGYELRAAVSLSRLFADQGRLDKARQLLVPVYGWFTEGFEMPDLREAKALLDEVG